MGFWSGNFTNVTQFGKPEDCCVGTEVQAMISNQGLDYWNKMNTKGYTVSVYRLSKSSYFFIEYK